MILIGTYLSPKDLYLWVMIMMSSTVSCDRLSGVVILSELTCVGMLMRVFSVALSSSIFYSESMSYMDIMTLQGEAHLYTGDLLVVGRFQGDEANAVGLLESFCPVFKGRTPQDLHNLRFWCQGFGMAT